MGNLMYKSTRGNKKEISSTEAILRGIAEDGGLYVPMEIPKMDIKLSELINIAYRDLAFHIIKRFFPDFNDDELRSCVDKAYDEKFEGELVAPLVEKQGVHFIELYHGPTLAFKDVALSILPYILTLASKKMNSNKEIVILTATSGDTGKAALEGFANVENTKIIVFFPRDGVSEIQKRQMITQKGENVFVIGIDGNFDDAQSGVKDILNDKELNASLNNNGYIFSSANSINIGRLVPQIVYYFNSYLNLLKEEKIKENEKINVVVPTGNFGNILAAYYAKEMGLPVNKFICASNENNVLSDFMSSGIYDRRRNFVTTASPSMDILISSNLERLLYELSEHDEVLIKSMMDELKENGAYEVNNSIRERLKDFYGGFATDDETLRSIKEVYEVSNYLIDTHTAVAYSVYEKYKKETGDNSVTIIASTASPFKFTRSVMNALDIDNYELNDFELIDELSKITGIIPSRNIRDLHLKEIIHNDICKKNEMKVAVKNILGI